MTKIIYLSLLSLFIALDSQAGFLDDLKKALEQNAKETATDIAVDITVQLIEDMFIGYTTKQTKTEKEVVKQYEEDNGSLPKYTIASSYKTRMSPGSSVSPGTEVVVHSVIEIIPGQNAKSVTIEERLTIYDNEDSSLVLKSMTKKAGRQSGTGGQFTGEFTFTLPEGMPQGVYPIQSELLLDGELAGDQDHKLQLVHWGTSRGNEEQVAYTLTNN